MSRVDQLRADLEQAVVEEISLRAQAKAAAGKFKVRLDDVRLRRDKVLIELGHQVAEMPPLLKAIEETKGAKGIK